MNEKIDEVDEVELYKELIFEIFDEVVPAIIDNIGYTCKINNTEDTLIFDDEAFYDKETYIVLYEAMFKILKPYIKLEAEEV